MSIIERINEHLAENQHLVDEFPILHLSWDDLYSMRIEDVAYASIYDWVYFDKRVYYGTRLSYFEGETSFKIDTDIKNIDMIMLLFAIKYNFWTEKVDKCDYVANKRFLKYAWNYAVENGLTDKDFGLGILSLGHSPVPGDENKYNMWLDSMKPRQVKSARKN